MSSYTKIQTLERGSFAPSSKFQQDAAEIFNGRKQDYATAKMALFDIQKTKRRCA